MDFDVFYHDMEKNERTTALSYLMLHLLKSAARPDCEASMLDQEVNVYLAHLLLSIGNPNHLEETKKFISTNDVEVASMITGSTDLSLKYLIYKSNADHLLTLTGLFNEPKAEKGAPPYPPREAGREKVWMCGMSADTLIGRGKAYYGFAAAYVKQIHRKVTAIMEVLERLSAQFERYSEILQKLSHAYFNLAQNVSHKEMKEFMEQVSRIEEELKLQELQDEFLDLYSLWLKSKDQELLKKVEALAQKIQKKDPSFTFTPPQHG